MADSEGRDRYLARVASALRMPDDAAREITAELDAHLDDTTSALVDEGLSPAQAEREAIARLGNPEDLASGVRRAHQPRRSLVTAVGPAIVVVIRSVIVAWIFGTGVAILSAVLAIVAMSWLLTWLGVHASGFEQNWSNAPVALFAAAYAGHRLPRAVAAWSNRRVVDVRVGAGLVGAIPIAFFAWFMVRLPMDLATVAVLGLVPVCFVAGAWRADDRPARRIPAWGFATILAAASVGSVAISIATAAWTGAYSFDSATARPVAPDWAEAGVPDSAMPTDAIATDELYSDIPDYRPPPRIVVRVAFATEAWSRAWSGIRAELWRSGPPAGPVLLDAAPVAVIPIDATPDLNDVGAEVGLPVARDRTWYRVAITAVAPDGRRYALLDWIHPFRVEAVGTAWDWIRTR